MEIKSILGTLVLLSLFSFLPAQYQSVVFDFERSYFNDGRPLPAETYFAVTGELTENVDAVRAGIYRDGAKPEASPLYENEWRRPPNKESTSFTIPMNVKLKSHDHYDLRVTYYKMMENGDKIGLKERLQRTCNLYLDQIADKGKRSFKLAKPAGFIISEMDNIVNRSMENYLTADNQRFPGFSEMIRFRVKQLNRVRVRNSDLLTAESGRKAKAEARNRILEGHLKAIQELVSYEIEGYFDRKFYAVAFSRDVDHYPTAETRKTISLHAGYGAALISNANNSPEFGTSPFAGISIPLANPASESRVLKNTSINTGVFLSNFTGPNGEVYSGPLLRRPFYLGLGYKIFYIFRLNAGAVVLEDRTNASGNLINLNQVNLRPYVGLSAEINIWVGLKDK